MASSRRTVLTAIGPDRPGIVDRISALIHDAGGNIEDSRMTILGEEFALILLFSGDAKAAARVKKGLAPLARKLKLTCTLKETQSRRAEARVLPYRLRVTGLDHPGIVHRVSAALADLGVNVAALDTRLAAAPESGAPLFVLSAEVEIPVEVPAAELRRALDRACAAETLDFTLEASEIDKLAGRS